MPRRGSACRAFWNKGTMLAWISAGGCCAAAITHGRNTPQMRIRERSRDIEFRRRLPARLQTRELTVAGQVPFRFRGIAEAAIDLRELILMLRLIRLDARRVLKLGARRIELAQRGKRFSQIEMRLRPVRTRFDRAPEISLGILFSRLPAGEEPELKKRPPTVATGT